LIEARDSITRLELELKRQQGLDIEHAVDHVKDLECVKSAAESQITALKVELAAMMKERDAAIKHAERLEEENARLKDAISLSGPARERLYLQTRLGRAVDVLRRLLGEHANADEFRVIRTEAESILADATATAAADRVPLWRELEKLVRSLSGGVIPVGCLIDVVLRKLAALDEKGGSDEGQ
jgi:hypothetical protein